MSMKKMLAVVAAAALVAIAAPAFAANPFSDVPMNHWAYDAVAQLTSRGVISGYPDGTFKGNKAMTRYEIASIIARSLANAEYATKEDMERLKALVVEFQPELEALGVTVDGFDSRLTKLEKGVGGLKVWGNLYMNTITSTESSENNRNLMDRYRIWVKKDINDNISFTTRLSNDGTKADKNGVNFSRYFLTVKDFFGMELNAGQYYFDWEGEDGINGPDNDPNVGAGTRRGLWLKKNFGMATVQAYYATAGGDVEDKDAANEYGAKVHFTFNEKIWLTGAVRAIKNTTNDTDRETYWFSAGFKFVPGVELMGGYYWQKHDLDSWDDSNMWKLALNVNQDVLKFTSLWVEYLNFDKGFKTTTNDQWDIIHRGGISAYLVPQFDNAYGTDNDVKVLHIRADQNWNEKWGSYAQYVKATDGVSDGYDYNMWALAGVYKFSPALKFELGYANYKKEYAAGDVEDKVIFLNTLLSF